ncbi:Protein CBG11682 [Caenorhabditis briggsae]|uniref:Protein CBG11682 n=1 Tax=Caenorhabditis briggsae TaxID=6238 RepID=A8XDZ3_CAEBR|nr:Protein CBG11682 [Caenorhabditis briggsae]CAP30888.2 Protein CBG11682 [Caenorhabditis briggsae]
MYLVITVDEEPTVAPPTTTLKPKKGGWINRRRRKRQGPLGGLYSGKEVLEEEEEEDNYDNYDTVKSLPASGHYGKSRVGNTSHTKLQDLADEIRQRGGAKSQAPPRPPVIIFRVPRKHANSMSSLRISPGGGNNGVVKAPLSDPVFDFYTWHTSEADNHDAVYSLFMKAHKCYDLIPTSSKLVVFDTHLPVRKAFYALVYNGVRAAPLWDTDNQRFTGMLTITDFIKILCKHYDKGDNAEHIRALEDQQISHWREQFEQDGTLRPFVHIDPNESLHRAVEILCESKVHRLPVLDRKTGNITYILTHKRIMKFLSLYMRDLPRPSFMSCSPRELGIGAWGDILCCHVDTPIHDALELFLKNRVSALPLIDEHGRVVDIYAKFDVISLAAENSYDKLDCTVQEALKHRSEWFEGVHTCQATDSLFQVLEAIVKAEVHRLIVTDQDRKVVGVVSLSDILKYLVLDPCQKPPAPPTRNASGTSQGGVSTDSPPNSIPEGVEIDEDEQEDVPGAPDDVPGLSKA